MPQMGESIAEGTLSRWLKKVGDEVKRDEPIFEISTDKVDAEIPAPSSGVLAEILVTEGQTVAVQTVVARLETEKGAAIGGGGAAAGTAAAGAGAEKLAASATAGSGPARGAGAPPAIQNTAASAGTRQSMYAPAGVDQHGPAPEAWPGDRVEPMTQIRRLTSDHMVAARRTAAHVTSFFEIDLTRIARIRAKARAEFEAKNGQKLTYLPFIIKVVVDALKQHPVLNAAVSGTNIIYRKQYNIGIAVALDWGLIVPVMKNADDLSITGLTKQLNDLAQRARAKRLQPQEVQGATFSITNPGVFGSLMGTPIIPINTSAILGLGAIEKRAKVIPGSDGEDTIAIRTCAYFSLSFDHRIVDGSDADKFLAFVKQELKNFPDAGVV